MAQKAACENCGREWPLDRLYPIKDIGQRAAPGEPMPAGECPECRAVCHLAEQKTGDTC